MFQQGTTCRSLLGGEAAVRDLQNLHQYILVSKLGCLFGQGDEHID